MFALLLFFSFLFGTVVGSFFNVVLIRLNTKEGISGRSHCRVCKHTLSATELIPLVSYVLLSGKCRHCNSIVSLQYPLIEFVTGFLFMMIFLLFGLSFPTLWYIVIFSFLLLIGVYDLQHKIIPNQFVYPLIILSVAAPFLDIEALALRAPSLLDLSAGPLFAAPFALLWFISNGKWMGFGDVKLSLSLGWLFGFFKSMLIFLLSFWIGAIISLAIILLLRSGLFSGSKKLTMRSEVPFAPFLIAGAVIVFFFNVDIFALLSIL